MLANMLHFTHLAVCEDCLRLIQHVPEICDGFKDVATHNLEDAQLGVVMWAKSGWSRRMLYLARAGWDGRRPSDGVEGYLAYSVGSIIRRACDKQLAPGVADDSRKLVAYRDAVVIREVYGEAFEPLPYGHLPFGGQSNLEEHIRVLTERMMLAQHTHVPDLQKPEDWLDKMILLRNDIRDAAEYYAEAFEHPDSDLVRQYITEPAFYGASDDLIRVARAIQGGGSVGQNAVMQALESGKNKSQYAQALVGGLRYLRAANGYFTGKIRADQLKEAWDATEDQWPQIWDGGTALVDV